MKKFLFTLATAMLAGGMFAGNFVSGGTEYFYMDDANVTENLGGTVVLNVKAHFEASVSAWQCDFGMYVDGEFVPNELEGGLTVKTAAKGSDLTLSFIDEAGDEGTTSPSLQKAQNNTRFIVTNMEGNYWDPDGDGEYELQGVAKWGPGEYEQMWKMTFNIPEDFEGAEVAIMTRPTSGFDNNPEVTLTAGDKAYYVVSFTVDGGEEPPMDLTGQIEIGEPTDDGLVAISYNGPEEVTLSVVLNGEPVELVDGMLQLIDGQNMIVVTATADGYKSLSETAEIEWIAPEPPQPPVDHMIHFDEETLTLTVEGEGEIHVYIDGVEVTVPYTFEQEEEDMTYEVTAVALVEGANPVIETMTITIPGTGGEPQPEKTLTPEASYRFIPGQYAVIVTITPYEGDVFYRITYSAPDGTVTESDWMAYIDEFILNEDGRYWVEYYAIAEGKLPSDIGEMVITVSPMGGIDEMASGKTIAGVRYFNMAGQEMQETNGMTIVVTTYTDGTTTAVKVMK